MYSPFYLNIPGLQIQHYETVAVIYIDSHYHGYYFGWVSLKVRLLLNIIGIWYTHLLLMLNLLDFLLLQYLHWYGW